jgi:hypothetical protein
MVKGLPRGCNQRGCHYTKENCVAFGVHSLHQHQPTWAARDPKFEEFSEVVKHREGPEKDGACVPTVIETQKNADSGGTASILSYATENMHILPPPRPPSQDLPASSQGSSGSTPGHETVGEASAGAINYFGRTSGSGERA